ncbi:DUF726 domain-containing protein [Coprinopsis cinerea AmutBmut pab1-1]|nr:DUF726 domain-containing protein [Coprinopsis cinerea AmutBmut pab1-1]
MPPATVPPPSKNVFDDDFDDDDGWQDMPIVRDDDPNCDLDEEDKRKYHYQPSSKVSTTANATGNLIDFDDEGNEWRSKLDQNEREYTRLRVREEDEADEVHLRTKYLFDEDKAMTPLNQMQATKNLLTEAQRIAYVGLCSLTSREMVQTLKATNRKELKSAAQHMELWMLKIMGRLYYHMELETQEQKMIESLAEHGVLASDLVPALMTTHTVANPEYDPEEARRRAEEESKVDDDDDESISDQTLVNEPTASPDDPKDIPLPTSPTTPTATTTVDPTTDNTLSQPDKTVPKVLPQGSQTAMPGVSTTLSAADKDVTLDIRWTVLCDLFLILIADSVYDARSRVLLENVATKLGLGWLDVVKFESRVTEALEIQEDVESLEQQEIVDNVRKAGKKRRYMMLGLATIGGGLVIGLSAGLLAPVIGVGLAGALGTIGVTGTGAFLGGTAGAAVITTGGVLTGGGIAAKGMARRTQELRTFEILPLHNNKRVNCILTVPGFMTGLNDDVRLPFSVLDPIVGDVFSVLWEPDMIRETGSALKILTGEVLSQIGMTVLSATVMTGLVSALQWPIILTKLGYLIDNPWSNALDRAKLAGKVLADTLIQRHLGVRPISLIGFSLGARVIYYALLELSRQKQYGIVQDVFLLGATVTMPLSSWLETRSVVSGRYVNAYARNDWVLNYLFRATAGGVGTVAGLRPVEGVPGLENVDVTDKIAGHMSYRTFMPLILDQLGFPVFSDYFDEPVEPDFEGDRVVVHEEEEQNKKKGWFSRKTSSSDKRKSVSRPPSSASWANTNNQGPTVPGVSKPPTVAGAMQPGGEGEDEDLPPRMENAHGTTTTLTSSPKSTSQPLTQAAEAESTTSKSAPTPLDLSSSHSSSSSSSPTASSNTQFPSDSTDDLSLPSKHAGFDLDAIRDAVEDVVKSPDGLKGASIAAAAGGFGSFGGSAAYMGGSGSSSSSYLGGSLGYGHPARPSSTPPTAEGAPSGTGRSVSYAYGVESSSGIGGSGSGIGVGGSGIGTLRSSASQLHLREAFGNPFASSSSFASSSTLPSSSSTLSSSGYPGEDSTSLPTPRASTRQLPPDVGHGGGWGASSFGSSSFGSTGFGGFNAGSSLGGSGIGSGLGGGIGNGLSFGGADGSISAGSGLGLPSRAADDDPWVVGSSSSSSSSLGLGGFGGGLGGLGSGGSGFSNGGFGTTPKRKPTADSLNANPWS